MVIRMDTEEKPVVDVMMSTEDMAKIIPLTKEALIDHIKHGDLEGFRIGRRYFVYSKVFYAWLETKRVTSASSTSMQCCTYYPADDASRQASSKNYSTLEESE